MPRASRTSCRGVSWVAALVWLGVVQTSSQGNIGNVYRAVDSLERLGQFLALHQDAVTPDHALGVAVSRGQVLDALGILRSNRDAESAALSGRLEEVLDVLEKVQEGAPGAQGGQAPLLEPWLWRGVESGESEVEHRFEDRFQDRLQDRLQDRAHDAAQPAGQALLELRELSGPGSPSERQSERCVAEVLASRTSPGTPPAASRAGCMVSQDCVRAETEGLTSGYASTHRVLYHHVANKVGCTLRDQGVGTRREIARLCDAILEEAEDIARAGFPPLLRDLFAEQVALCGVAGSLAFARAEWLDRVLGWQRPAGCFGNATELRVAVEPFLLLRDNARLYDPLGGECLSHLTGVCAAAVAFNLRVLVQRWSDQLISASNDVPFM